MRAESSQLPARFADGRSGGTVRELAFLIELEALKGRQRLEGYDVFSVIQYD